MRAGASGPIPSSEEIVRSECWNEVEDGAEDEFRGEGGFWGPQTPIGNTIQSMVVVVCGNSHPLFMLDTCIRHG